MLPTWLQAYSKRQEIDEASKRRILSVSPATLDRVLRDCKVDDIHKANKQTISALKQSIPIIDTTRKIDVAGHLYADTVAHCGDSTRGSFTWTLTVTDDLTLWTLIKVRMLHARPFYICYARCRSWFAASTQTMVRSLSITICKGCSKKSTRGVN